MLWAPWHHSPSWAVSVNLQEGKELGEDLLCTSDKALSCFPTPGWVFNFLKRKELCTAAESAPGSAYYISITQGEISAKASVTDIHKSSQTARLLGVFPALESVWIKWTLQNSGMSSGVAMQLWHLYEHNSILNNPLAVNSLGVTESPWEQSGQLVGKGLRSSQQLCLPAVLPGTWTRNQELELELGREMRAKEEPGLAGS